MSSSVPVEYERTRARHFAYMSELLPQHLARLSWTREQIDAQQTRSLRELLAHASGGSAWHRERLGHVDADGMSACDLHRIPIMRKDDLMANWDRIVTDRRCTLAGAEAHISNLTSDAYFLDDLHVIASGGSSGSRGVFVFDWHGWAEYWISGMRGLLAGVRATGRQPTGPIASVSAYDASHATSALAQTFTDPARPTVRAPVTLPVRDIVALLNRCQPSVLHSYPSMLPTLCEEVRSGRLRIDPLVVLSTSEPLLPEVRALAEATWSAPVLNFWAASETGGTFPCPTGGHMHVNEDLNIIEPVDDHGNPVAPGESSSRILITNLSNRILPLIRYEITDEFQIADGPSPCGSAFLRVANVQGRKDDVFEYGGDVRVHPLNFRSALGKDPAIVEYQVRQTRHGADVILVGHAPVDIEQIRSTLETRLAELGVMHAQVTVRQVDRIERQSTGKLKRFVPVAAR